MWLVHGVQKYFISVKVNFVRDIPEDTLYIYKYSTHMYKQAIDNHLSCRGKIKCVKVLFQFLV